jgi:hypothetical protein
MGLGRVMPIKGVYGSDLCNVLSGWGYCDAKVAKVAKKARMSEMAEKTEKSDVTADAVSP